MCVDFSGLTWEELEPCVRWMTIHKEVLDKHQPKAAVLKTYASVPECNAHKIQNHSVNKALWVSERVLCWMDTVELWL